MSPDTFEHVAGLGSIVARVVCREEPCPMGFVGLENTFAESGPPRELLEKYGLTAQRIVEEARGVVARKVG